MNSLNTEDDFSFDYIYGQKRGSGAWTKLLNKKLIACYNILPVEAAYWWKGKIVDENELLMIIKTNKKFEIVKKFIAEHHSYDTPEIVGIDTKLASEKYLTWLRRVTGRLS